MGEWNPLVKSHIFNLVMNFMINLSIYRLELKKTCCIVRGVESRLSPFLFLNLDEFQAFYYVLTSQIRLN